jgi:hypothetical protein
MSPAKDLGFSRLTTIRELAKPQAIPGRENRVTHIYLSGMALSVSPQVLTNNNQHFATKPQGLAG